MNRRLPANPWGQLLRQIPKSTPTPGNFPTRKVRLGTVQQPPTSKSKDRADFSRAFIHQLDGFLELRAREFEALWERGALPKAAQTLVTELFLEACAAIDTTLHHKREGAPPTLKRARALLKKTRDLEKVFDDLLDGTRPRALELAFCIRDLCDDIAHYVQQIEVTYAIVSAQATAPPRPANRPTNRTAKDAFADVVYQHQLKHGAGTFPKPAAVRSKLTLSGHTVSDRILRYWRDQMKAGTFTDHIQHRKRQ
jgi:hypothetical protein